MNTMAGKVPSKENCLVRLLFRSASVTRILELLKWKKMIWQFKDQNSLWFLQLRKNYK